MIRTLIWKEYREQRTTGSVLLVFGLGLIVSIHMINPYTIANFSAIAGLLICLAWIMGLIAGAQAFAGEFENRTQVWLDSLPVWRWQVGYPKAAFALAAALVQCALMFAFVRIMGWIEDRYIPEAAWGMLAYAFAGAGCGLLGSALAQSPLAALGVALLAQIAVLAFGYLLAEAIRSITQDHPANWMTILAAPLTYYLALNRYAALDRARRRGTNVSFETATSAWRSLRWLVWRQSRHELKAFCILGLICAVAMQPDAILRWASDDDHRAPIRLVEFWPVAGLVFGLIVGIRTFGADRPEAFRLLGDLRAPYRQVWLVKSVLRFAILMIPILMQVALRAIFSPRYFRAAALDLSNLLLGPLYGFALGQVLGLVCRKTEVAGIIAFLLGALFVGLWWPSIINSGLHAWQWLPAPLIFIAISWLATRPWVSNRLASWRSATLAVAASLVAIGSILFGLWYRVAEPPVHGDPFDVAAFEASLPKPEQNQSGVALGRLLEKHEVPFSTLDGSSNLGGSPQWVNILKIEARARAALANRQWPADDAELNQWLDEIVANPWYTELREIVRLPLGRITSGRWATDAFPSISQILQFRILQLLSRSDESGALDVFSTGLALSRHQRSMSFAHTYQAGALMEDYLLELIPALVAASANSPGQLEQLLSIINEHTIAVPPLNDVLKIEFLELQSQVRSLQLTPSSTYDTPPWLARAAAQAPWEYERSQRILATLWAGYLRTNDIPYAEFRRRTALQSPIEFQVRWKLRGWTPPASDPAIARQKSHRLAGMMGDRTWYYVEPPFGARIGSETNCRAAQLQVALALYQLRHGKHAESLDQLVPEILPTLPLDPYSDESFHYRVSKGETIEAEWGGDSKGWTIPVDTAIIWSVGPDLINNHGRIWGDSRWPTPHVGSFDIIFRVPQVR